MGYFHFFLCALRLIKYWKTTLTPSPHISRLFHHTVLRRSLFKRRLYFFLNFEFARNSHVRDRSFLKMYQLKKYWTDFDRLFFKKKLEFFPYKTMKSFCQNSVWENFYSDSKFVPKFTMLWKFFPNGILTKLFVTL